MFLEKQDWSGAECLDIPALACDRHIIVDRFSRAHEARRAVLTGLEQGVVGLSLFDHRSSVDAPRGVARLMNLAFGFRPANQLADVRLEALRRYCILLRISEGAPPAEERDRMRNAGYSDAALEEAARLVAIGRSSR